MNTDETQICLFVLVLLLVLGIVAWFDDENGDEEDLNTLTARGRMTTLLATGMKNLSKLIGFLLLGALSKGALAGEPWQEALARHAVGCFAKWGD